MKLKKIIGAILFTGLFAGVSVAQAEVLYFNDFESYTGGAFATTVSEGTQGWTGISNTAKLVKQTDDGNTYLDVQGGTKWTFDMGGALTSGKIHISYDVEITEVADSTTTASNNYIRYKYKNTDYKYLLYTDVVNDRFYNNLNFNTSGNIGINHSFGTDNKFRVDLLFDIQDAAGKSTMTLAINGDIVGTVSRSKLSFYGIEFYLTQEMAIDNLKIEKYDDESLCVEEAWVENSEVFLKFSETLSANSALDGFSLKNLYDGTSVSVSSAVLTGKDTVKLTVSGEISAFDEYAVTLPSGLSDFYGTEITGTKIVSFPGEQDVFAVNSVEFEDYDGNKYTLVDQLPPEIKSINIGFNQGVNQVDAGISITNSQTPVSFNTDGNTVKVLLDGCLVENGEYELLIVGLENTSSGVLFKNYAIPFSTGEGDIKVVDFAFYKNHVPVTAESLNAGDEISISFKAIKPTAEELDFYLSYGVFENGLISGFNLSKVTADEDRTSVTGELQFQVPSSAPFEIKGFLWKKSGGFPYTEQIELIKN